MQLGLTASIFLLLLSNHRSRQKYCYNAAIQNKLLLYPTFLIYDHSIILKNFMVYLLILNDNLLAITRPQITLFLTGFSFFSHCWVELNGLKCNFFYINKLIYYKTLKNPNVWKTVFYSLYQYKNIVQKTFGSLILVLWQK